MMKFAKDVNLGDRVLFDGDMWTVDGITTYTDTVVFLMELNGISTVTEYISTTPLYVYSSNRRNSI